MAPVHWAAGSDGETNFGLTSLAAPNAASSSVARYSFVARLTACASSSLFHCEPGVDRCLLASATIRLAFTAKPSPPTRPAPRCTRPQHARTHCGRCRCRGTARCAHARTPNDPGPYPRWTAHKTNDRRSSLAHHGTKLAQSGTPRHFTAAHRFWSLTKVFLRLRRAR